MLFSNRIESECHMSAAQYRPDPYRRVAPASLPASRTMKNHRITWTCRDLCGHSELMVRLTAVAVSIHGRLIGAPITPTPHHQFRTTAHPSLIQNLTLQGKKNHCTFSAAAFRRAAASFIFNLNASFTSGRLTVAWGD